MKVKLNLIFHCALLYFLAFDIFHGNVLINELSVRQKNSSMVWKVLLKKAGYLLLHLNSD